MIRLENKEDFERDRDRLLGRDPDALAMFLMSLAGNSGPIGEQVRTFIVGDDVGEAVQSVRQRIRGLHGASEYEHRHSLGREIGTTLDFIVDSVERLVLPNDPKAAFELLVNLFEADAVAMENCHDHDWDVTCAYKRAAGVMAAAAKYLPRAELEGRVRVLVNDDGYGVRAALSAVIAEEHADSTGAAPSRDTKSVINGKSAGRG